MESRSLSLLLLAALLGCAGRNDAAVEAAWNRGVQGEETPLVRRDPTRDDEPEQGPTLGNAPATGWSRVDDLLERTLDVMTTAPSPEVFGELAQRWCQVEPKPLNTPHGSVRVCFLDPPVMVEGIRLSLELSDRGVVGFVAQDLDASASGRLVAAARSALAHHCTNDWERPPGMTFTSCAIAGGSTLAVGRHASDEKSAAWQVSIAVLGAI